MTRRRRAGSLRGLLEELRIGRIEARGRYYTSWKRRNPTWRNAFRGRIGFGLHRNAQKVASRRGTIHVGAETLLADTVAAGDGVVSVFDGVFGTTREKLANEGPLVAHLELGVDQNLVFLLCPNVF